MQSKGCPLGMVSAKVSEKSDGFECDLNYSCRLLYICLLVSCKHLYMRNAGNINLQRTGKFSRLVKRVLCTTLIDRTKRDSIKEIAAFFGITLTRCLRTKIHQISLSVFAITRVVAIRQRSCRVYEYTLCKYCK